MQFKEDNDGPSYMSPDNIQKHKYDIDTGKMGEKEILKYDFKGIEGSCY